jgi:two-component system sensor histidine kinase VicK
MARCSKQDSPVVIGAKGSDGYIIVTVINKGMDIRSRLTERMFDRFCQVDNLINDCKRQVDVGLLYTYRDIIEAHGGKIRAASKINKGSRFSFTLPVEKNLSREY